MPVYLEQVQGLLWRFRGQADIELNGGPRWFPRQENWTLVTFRAELRFVTGHILDVTDDFDRKSDHSRQWRRKFAYYFGDPAGGTIFLLDTHGLFGSACHLHLDEDTRLESGDPRLNGFVPDTIEMAAICRFVQDHFEQRPFPWVRA